MKWFDKNGEHEQGLSDEEMKKDLRDLRGIDQLLMKGAISEELHRKGQNILRPAEDGHEALGDMFHTKQMETRGRKRKERGLT